MRQKFATLFIAISIFFGSFNIVFGNDLKKAIEAYNKALLYNPNDAQANYNMGIAFKAQGKLDKAIASFNKSDILSLHTILYSGIKLFWNFN